MKRYLIRSLILTAGYFILGTILYTLVIPQHYLPILPFIPLFFFLITNLVHAYLLKIAGKDIGKFSARYMAMSFLKLLFFLLAAILYLLAFKEHAKLFSINYLAVYLGFTVLAVAEISRIVKLRN